MTTVTVHSLLDAHFRDIIEAARLAPSVHNTQPWQVKRTADTIVITPDPHHHLRDGDPTGRQGVMSLGIFAEAISMLADTYGLSTSQPDYQEGKITLSFIRSTPAPGSQKNVRQLLKQRTTDRSIYKPVDITPTQAGTIEQAWSEENATVHVLTEPAKIKRIGALTAQGIGVAMSSPSFRQELSGLLVEPWSKKTRGISVQSLYIPTLLAILEPLMLRAGIRLGAEPRLERRRWYSASAVICITTPGDMPAYWFTAGRAYIRVALAIESLGLSQATSAATVEASTFHEDIEELLGTKERLQSTIRIGKGAARRKRSPRVSSDELIVT